VDVVTLPSLLQPSFLRTRDDPPVLESTLLARIAVGHTPAESLPRTLVDAADAPNGVFYVVRCVCACVVGDG
jgi:hypothetical protein